MSDVLRDNIILTGFSGTGKSSVGTAVAQALGWDFIDTDLEIEQRTGESIPNVFSQQGEKGFRKLEKTVLHQTLTGTRRVIAVGGGALIDPISKDLALRRGFVIALEATPETIYRRLRSQSQVGDHEERPLLLGPDPMQKIRMLKNNRQSSYADAHWLIQTELLTEHQVISEIIRASRITVSGNANKVDSATDLVAIVSHANGAYPIKVGWGLLDRLGELMHDMGISKPVYIISDSNVFPIYGRQAQRSLQRAEIEAHCFVIPAGEQSKCFEMANAIYHWLVGRKAERSHTIVAVGGGVVGDLAGYVAATYLRGMPFVQVPTSMAAMVDASIGGKVAVNLTQGKNLVGSFYQPLMVLSDPAVMNSLGKRELAEGWAEVIKHGFILDRDLVSALEANATDLMELEPGLSTDIIKRSIKIKAQVVSEDERETFGKRILLNYGHTIGHALEASTDYGVYLHGEGVAIGMMGAALIGKYMGITPPEVVTRQKQILSKFNLPISCSGIDHDRIKAAMASDKKMDGESIQWVLLKNIGQAVVRPDVPEELVQKVLLEIAG